MWSVSATGENDACFQLVWMMMWNCGTAVEERMNNFDGDAGEGDKVGRFSEALEVQ